MDSKADVIAYHVWKRARPLEDIQTLMFEKIPARGLMGQAYRNLRNYLV
jgi:hypothetical protein